MTNHSGTIPDAEPLVFPGRVAESAGRTSTVAGTITRAAALDATRVSEE